MFIQFVTDSRLKQHFLDKLQMRLQAQEDNPAAVDKTDVIDIRGTANDGGFTVLISLRGRELRIFRYMGIQEFKQFVKRIESFVP